MAREPGEYLAAANRYCDAVLSGKRPACKWELLAVQRHVRDMRRALQRDFAYRFDPELAERICHFAELLPHVKGKWARKRTLIHLGDWQCFILVSLFGWVHKRGAREGLRRFREALVMIPRKNGKSVLAAIIGLYLWCMDGEPGAEVYSGATTEKQAWEVYRPARLMLEASQDLVDELGGRPVRWKQLLVESDHSRFEPIIGKPGDGASPSCSIIDEYHEHDSPDMVDTMRTGMLAREQPLMLIISTAGVNLAGPCYDAQLTAQKVLEGSFVQDEQFVIIYGIDEGDDWTSPAILLKANPNLDVSVDGEMLAAMQRDALLNPVNQTPFKTKHLNVWCAARTVWMPLTVWDACKDTALNAEEFMGEPFLAILDLASKDDIAAYTKWFRKLVGSVMHHYIFSRYYLPSTALEIPSPNLQAYRRWTSEGWLTLTPGAEIDFDRIQQDVLDDKNKHQLLELVYDPWRATQLAQHIAKSGVVVVEMRHTVPNMSTPMKELLSAAKAGRVHHDNNPVTRWMMSNVTAQLDAKDNIYPRKEKPHMKIDGAITAIMGMGRAMQTQPAGIEQWLRDPVVLGASGSQNAGAAR